MAALENSGGKNKDTLTNGADATGLTALVYSRVTMSRVLFFALSLSPHHPWEMIITLLFI